MFFCEKNPLGDLVQRPLAGFAAGVMVAASWSLLIPAIEQNGGYGEAVLSPRLYRILGRRAVLLLLVEPIGAVLTLLAAQFVIPAIAVFAEELCGPGAMLYVVVERLIPK